MGGGVMFSPTALPTCREKVLNLLFFFFLNGATVAAGYERFSLRWVVGGRG